MMKWLGTALCLLGIALTSLNVYPINLWFGLIGSAIWTYAGFIAKDNPLTLVEGVAVVMYAFSIAKSVS